MAEERNSWPAIATVKVSKEVNGGGVARDAAAMASPETYAHKRSSSEMNSGAVGPYGNGSGGGVYGRQTFSPSSLPHRERRTRSWDLSADPELLRKKRLASYKVYGIEGKMKASLKRSLHWVKGKYNKLVYGFK